MDESDIGTTHDPHRVHTAHRACVRAYAAGRGTQPTPVSRMCLLTRAAERVEPGVRIELDGGGVDHVAGLAEMWARRGLVLAVALVAYGCRAEQREEGEKGRGVGGAAYRS